MNSNFFPFLLTIIAGFSTMIGTIPIFFKFKNEKKIICSSLGFASGVMISISVIDLSFESITLLSPNFDKFIPYFLCFLFLILGIIISTIVDYFLPNDLNINNRNNSSLYKVGLISMIAIILHNIPEGIATFITSSKDINLGISLATAIAFHNIPEGISISVPIYYATKSKLKAIVFTLISALSEPLGALITYFFLVNIINNTILGFLFALIAGIMIQISLVELLPKAKSYKFKYLTTISFFIGVLFVLLFN